MGTFDELDARKHEVQKVSQFLDELLPHEEENPAVLDIYEQLEADQNQLEQS